MPQAWFGRQSGLLWVYPLSVISSGLDKLLLTGLLRLRTILAYTFFLAGYLGTVHIIRGLCEGLGHALLKLKLRVGNVCLFH